MVNANAAITTAPADSNLSVLTAAFEEARSAHATLKAAGERADMLEAAKRELPVEPVERESDVRVGSEPLTYHKRSANSFLMDQYRASKGDRGAAGRLERHMQEMVVEGVLKDGEQRAIAETAGAGGELVAPLFWQEEFVSLARAGRPYVDALRPVPLPPNTNTINIPRMTTGTAVAAQDDLGAVQSTDLATGTITIPVITEAGQQDFARQLWDRSDPALLDGVVFPDLINDYNTKVNQQAISGSGVPPNALGVLNVPGTNAVTYTSASPTPAGVYAKVADAIQRIHTSRFAPATLITMAPRRWGWFLSQVDSTGRPLVVPVAQGPNNSLAEMRAVVSEGIVGTLQGVPVLLDASVPTTLGTGGNEDRIIVQRAEDSYFMEDQPIKTKVYEEVLSGVLAVRAQCFNYFAVCHNRRPLGIAVISGTGLTQPAF